ncbi:hypothetical protein A6769_33350 [Nostoc punctiforme NIES-2108]|uniref:STAS/SEC14 domain-containing protein n=1 Tax=Nostoc punctiforme NIES-2108 TaxID=1356359 RepID=A0A367R4D6_NOSPU|nr:hypothetical protein A6769_33350 [Nostoc punctiforme NIES-2108]
MTVPIEIRKRAIALLEQLPGESLVKAVEFLESLSYEALQGSQTTMPQAGEAGLIEVIQHHLSPEQQDRLTYLRQQNETGEITQTEHQELLMYVERVEQEDAERAEALIQLAQLRSCDLKVLINEFLPTHTNVI